MDLGTIATRLLRRARDRGPLPVLADRAARGTRWAAGRSSDRQLDTAHAVLVAELVR